MFAIWMKSTAVVGAAMLVPLALAPAIAQGQGAGAQSVPVEMVDESPGAERQSKPRASGDTPKELRLRNDNAVGICITKADSEGEAVENCTTKLACQPPAAPSCKRRPNFDDYRCVCK